MKTQARVNLNSLKIYMTEVSSLRSLSRRSDNGESVFSEIIEDINENCDLLGNKYQELQTAQSDIEEKITEYQEAIEEVQAEIDYLTDDLENIRAEMEITPYYYSYYDRDGNYQETVNWDYERLERQEAAVERKLSQRYYKLNKLEQRLNRCYSVQKQLNTLVTSIDKRISELLNYRKSVEKCRDQFRRTKKDLYNVSNNAYFKLEEIEKNVRNYTGVRLDISSAFDRDVSYVNNQTLDNLEYISGLRRQFEHYESSKINMKRTDDLGNEYKNEQGLIPNNSFVLNGYSFKTDNVGRPISASGKLRLMEQKVPRKWDGTIQEMGQGDERPSDDKGHIIGHRFGGPDSMANAFPQDISINRGEYKTFEDYLAQQLETRKDVFVSFALIYKNGSRRPIGVAVSYTINGKMGMRYFPNEREE